MDIDPTEGRSDVAIEDPAEDEPLLRVMALHALLYCERLYYLEEVEEIRVADAAVYAGRRLHEEILPEDDETRERRSLEVASPKWGIFGKVDAVRKRNGAWVVYEHKRGRCRRGPNKEPLAWPSDRLQAVAYAVLLEEELGQSVTEARVRYHKDNVTAFVEVNEAARAEVRDAISRAKTLRQSSERPPVHENERVCARRSLNVVCLPEEERLALFEQRLQESYKHPHTGQSLTYARMVELEVRLLEKEWTGCPNQFARLRMR